MNRVFIGVDAETIGPVRRAFGYCREHPVAGAVIVAVFFRLAVFFGSMVWPILNENMAPVSPLHGQGYLDFAFYVDSLNQYRTESIGSIFQKFLTFYQRPFQEHFGHIIAGPVFPLLIGAFGYADGNTLPLAVCFLIFNSLWWAMWLIWFANRGVGAVWLYIMALIPNPVWFMLVVSPDFVLAALVGAFYILYMREQQNKMSVALWALLLFCIVLTRPNGYSVLLFVLLDRLWRHYRLRDGSGWLIALVGMSAILAGLYLFPYFVTEMRKTMVNHVFFGMPTTNYWAGLYPELPRWLDVALSLLALVGAKVLYLVGLRPAYGMASDGLVLMRALPGLVLLPGMIWGLLFAGMRTRIFLFIFLFPILLGPSQDRYNLPIFPLLFGFGGLAFSAGLRRLGRVVQGQRAV